MIRRFRGWSVVEARQAVRRVAVARLECRAPIRHVLNAWRWLSPVAAALLVGLATPALSATIGVAMLPLAAFPLAFHDGIETYAKSVPGLAVQFTYADAGAGDKQIAQVQGLIAAKVDALVILPVDPAANATITRLAQEADIPLIYVNDGPREDWLPGRVAFVLPNDLVAGRLQMRKLAQMLNGTGRFAIITGPPSHPAAALRTQGVREVAAQFPGLRIVEETRADWDRKTAASVVAEWLARGTALDAIVANNDDMAIGAADAVDAAGIPADRILIAGVDATPDGLKAMQQKRMAVTVYQDAGFQARRAIDDALKLIRHEPVQQYDWAPFELVTDRMSTTHFSR